MNISFITPQDKTSGGMRVIFTHANFLASKGHKVTIIFCTFPRDAIKTFIKQWLFKPKKNTNATTKNPWRPDHPNITFLTINIKKIAQKGWLPDDDIFIATWWETAAWLAKAPIQQNKCIYFLQGYKENAYIPNDHLEASYRLPYTKIVVSRWLQEQLLKYDSRPAKIILNAFDKTQYYANERTKNSVPCIGFTYSNCINKGGARVEQALKRVKAVLPSLKIIAFGNKPLASQWLEQHVEYHHQPDQSKIRSLYSACDVWLSGSLAEGFNLPILEAMACGTPVICGATGWPYESITDKQQGLIIDPLNIPQLANAITTLINMSCTQWQQLSTAAIATANTLDWETSSTQFEQVLMNVKQTNTKRK